MDYVTSVCVMGIIVICNEEVKEKGILEAYTNRKLANKELHREADITIGEYQLKGWELEGREEIPYDHIWLEELEEIKLTFVRRDYEYASPLVEHLTVSLWLEDTSVMK